MSTIRSLCTALALALGTVGLVGAGAAAQAADTPEMVVYKSPTCGCCGAWIEHMQAAGYTVVAKDTDALTTVKRMLGVPDALQSCHTAVIDGYVVEGHVPAEQVDALLKDRPEVAGIAVPGMPQSSPGMDVPGADDAYEVVAFESDGDQRVVARY